MPTYTYPVLLWTDAAGAWTGIALGDFEMTAASAETSVEVLRQLREVMEWRLEHEPWNAETDFLEPALREVKVEVRPQHRILRRVIPCPDTVPLRVPCVSGRQSSGLWVGAVPHLGMQFTFQNPDDLATLVSHYVKERLQQLTPVELAAQWPPTGCQLEQMTVRHGPERDRRVPAVERLELKPLFKVADPLLLDRGRKSTASAAYGREALTQKLAGKLGQDRASVLLVGEAGVGKSTVLREAVRLWVRQAEPAAGDEEEGGKALRQYRYWRGSGGRLIAGMRYLGEWQQRCEEFVEALAAVQGVFCVENLLELLSVGGEGPGDSVAAFLLPYLQRGELRLMAEATPHELEACRRWLPSLLDHFQILVIPPFEESASLGVLDRIASAQASGTEKAVEPGVTALVHRLFLRYQPYAAFPGPAARFLRGLFEEERKTVEPRQNVVTCGQVVRKFGQQTGLPELFLRDELRLDPAQWERDLARQIIGQPEATAAASRLVAAIKAGLTDPARPLGVLLFCGPSGVGKTALARTLVEFCFGAGAEKDRLIRLDMSEYAGWGASQRLLEGPAGGPAAWIERVRRQPFCVVLLDEIEKAAPEVFDNLLGVLDEGRLSDRLGRVTWFRSAIIILTSNIGANTPLAVGFGADASAPYESEVMRFFRPEFFNRLDAVVTFRSLAREQMEAITRKELEDLAAREGLAASGLRLEWSDRVVAMLAREGFDPRLGARPLQRAVETFVAVPLARWRAEHGLRKAVTLQLDWQEPGGLRITEVSRGKG